MSNPQDSTYLMFIMSERLFQSHRITTVSARKEEKSRWCAQNFHWERQAENSVLLPHDVHELAPLLVNLPQGHSARFWESPPWLPWQTEAALLRCDWLRHYLGILSPNSRVKVVNDLQPLPWAPHLIYYMPSLHLPVCTPRQQAEEHAEGREEDRPHPHTDSPTRQAVQSYSTLWKLPMKHRSFPVTNLVLPQPSLHSSFPQALPFDP